MEPRDVDAVLAHASGLDLRFERLLRRALERIPLRYEELGPLHVFLTGYREAIATSLRCAEEGWCHVIVLDRHDFVGRDDGYVLEAIAHEIAHLRLGHGKLRGGPAAPRLCEEARRLVAEWGFAPGG